MRVARALDVVFQEDAQKMVIKTARRAQGDYQKNTDKILVSDPTSDLLCTRTSRTKKDRSCGLVWVWSKSTGYFERMEIHFEAMWPMLGSWITMAGVHKISIKKYMPFFLILVGLERWCGLNEEPFPSFLSMG